MKTIKETIGEKEYKRLKAYIIADDKLRKASKRNLLRAFTLLYYSGCRVSELLQITIGDIKHLIKCKELIIETQKTKIERKVQFSDKAIKDIKSLFADSLEHEPENTYIILSRGSITLNRTPNKSVFTNQVNDVIHHCLGSRYSSHSFRRGIITEMASKKVNPKVIQSFIGHKDIKTTMLYVTPSDDDIRKALVR